MPTLFDRLKIKDVTLKNRIAVPPMCQYSAVDGVPNDWHRTHYASLARGGAGLVSVEATAVSPKGRITTACTGLWNDGQTRTGRPQPSGQSTLDLSAARRLGVERPSAVLPPPYAHWLERCAPEV